MELGDRAAEALGIAADFVEREQQVVAVERRVLEPLRLHRPGVLLQLHRELQPLARLVGVGRRVAVAAIVAPGGTPVVRSRAQHHLAEEVEERALHRRVAAPRARDRALDDGAVVGGPALLVDVGAVDGEAGDDLGDARRAGCRA